ncbi:hypothetical protein IAR55_005409 [Kwoniella newhampshirensis]|uniref:BZIP domain-containing protein n=1 Tax=Kwoniella newhampshirensis TaxID=1651941 RepID=A0AAW0YW65_9TREE
MRRSRPGGNERPRRSPAASLRAQMLMEAETRLAKRLLKEIKAATKRRKYLKRRLAEAEKKYENLISKSEAKTKKAEALEKYEELRLTYDEYKNRCCKAVEVLRIAGQTLKSGPMTESSDEDGGHDCQEVEKSLHALIDQQRERFPILYQSCKQQLSATVRK